MGSPKGSGYIERKGEGRSRQYRARLQVNGERIVGAWRSSYELAQNDRKALAPKATKYSMTVSELVGWLIDGRYRKEMAPETIATHRSVLGSHIEGSRIGRTQVQAVKATDFQEFVDSLDAGPQTVRKAGSVVSRAFYAAKRLRMVEANPCLGAVYPRIKRRRNVVLQEGQFELLADPSNLVESMMVVSLHTMLRRSEVCLLKWSEIVGETVLKESDKTDDARAVPMSPQVSQIVRSQPKRSQYVFSRDDGSPPDPDWYTKQWKKWRDAHGIDPRVRLHDLRGSSVTLLLAKGYDLKTVQGLARHRDGRTTINIYAQVVDANKKAAVSALSMHTTKAHQGNGDEPKEA